ncbi:HAD-IA family hydrolase [Pendulispora rubella]|uniref:phosphoglycolate phosphatase n=1 Tax=Pendulispora rubella TaxID=2741070 RepID=A0ABZ2KZG1_9BACT
MKAVLFDFDYTLADSSPGIIACVTHALTVMGIPLASDDAICRTIGLSLPDTFSRLSGIDDEQARIRFKELYLERARYVMVGLTELFPGVRETLHALAARGLRLGIVSTKISPTLRKILEKEDLLSLFGVIIGGDDVTRTKPDPEGIHRALEVLEVQAHECLYVGDAVMDVEAARRAGTSFAAVLTGATLRHELEALGAVFIFDRVNDLDLGAISPSTPVAGPI